MGGSGAKARAVHHTFVVVAVAREALDVGNEIERWLALFGAWMPVEWSCSGIKRFDEND